MPSLVNVELADNFEYWRLLTNNLVSWANIGVYANGTPTAGGANVVIVGDLTSSTLALRDTNPTINFRDVANSALSYIKYDVSANAFVLFSGAANASISYYANGSLQVNSVPVVTTSATQTLTAKTLTSPAINSPTIIGGTIATLATDLAVADGGTGASDAATARTNLGLAIGTNVQAYDAGLQSISGLTTAANQMIYTTALDAYATTALTSFARTILDDADATATRSTLGLVIGTNVQAYNADLQAISTLTSAADRLPYYSGIGTASLATFTAFARTLMDDADATAARATLGLGTMAVAATTSYQPIDAGLTSISGLTTLADRMIYTTASDTYAVTPITAFGRSILDDVDAASVRATLGLGNAALANTGDYATLSGAETFTGAKTFTSGSGIVVSSANAITAANYFVARPTDATTGKPYLYLNGGSSVSGNSFQFGIYDGTNTNGTLDFSMSNMTWNSVQVVNLSATQTLSNKTLTNPTVNGMVISGTATYTTQTVNSNNTTLATTAYVDRAVSTGGGAYQPLDAGLTSISALTTAADKLIYTTALDTYAITTLTSYGRSLIDDTDAATARATLGLGTMAVEVAANYATLAGTQIFTGQKTFKSTANATTVADVAIWGTTEALAVGKPWMYLSKDATADVWNYSLYDGTNNNGTINFTSSNLTWLDVPLVSTTATQTLSGKTLTSPTINSGTFGTAMTVPTFSGTNQILPGNADGASYTNANFILKGWYGMHMQTYDNSINGYYDFRLGKWDVKNGFYVNGNAVLVNTAIGSTVQAYDAGLASIAGLTTAADRMIYTTAADTYATTGLSAYARGLLDDSDATTARATLGLGNIATDNGVSYVNVSGGVQTISTLKTISLGTAVTGQSYWVLKPTDYAASKPGMFFEKSATANVWSILLWDGTNNAGTINLDASTVLHAGVPVLTTTGTQTVTNKTISSSTFSGTHNGGSVINITDITIADGGTGASDAATARTNLGLAIGSNVQAYDAALSSIAGLAINADQMIYGTAADTYATATLTAYGRSLVATASAASARSTLGLGTVATLAAPAGTLVGTSDVQTLTNKTFTGDVAHLTGTFGSGAANAAFNSISLATALPIASGGTGTTTAGGIRSALSLTSADTPSFAGVTLTAQSTTTHSARNFNMTRTGSNGAIIDFNSPSGAAGSITVSGLTTAYGTSSDHRLKYDIKPIVADFTLTSDQFASLDNSILKIMSLRPVHYKWVNDPENVNLSYGFIAHELQEVLPDLVTGEKDGFETAYTLYDEDGEIIKENVGIEDAETIAHATKEETGTRPVYQGVDYSKLTPYLTAAIQSMTLKLLEKDDEIAELKSTLNSVLARLDALENS